MLNKILMVLLLLALTSCEIQDSNKCKYRIEYTSGSQITVDYTNNYGFTYDNTIQYTTIDGREIIRNGSFTIIKIK